MKIVEHWSGAVWEKPKEKPRREAGHRHRRCGIKASEEGHYCDCGLDGKKFHKMPTSYRRRWLWWDFVGGYPVGGYHFQVYRRVMSKIHRFRRKYAIKIFRRLRRKFKQGEIHINEG